MAAIYAKSSIWNFERTADGECLLGHHSSNQPVPKVFGCVEAEMRRNAVNLW